MSVLSFQVYYLLHFITRTKRELTKFIDSIKQEDYSLKYPTIKNKNSIAELHESFNSIIDSFNQVKKESQVQYNFLQLIIGQIEIGILVLNENEEIVFMNAAAERLLNARKTKTWLQLITKTGLFGDEIESIFQGGKKLIEWKTQNEFLNF